MNDLLTLALGIVAGGMSFLVVQFWMNPLLRYLSIKHEVTSDLVFYANVVNADGLNEQMQALHEERRQQNRKHGAEIRASYYRLPGWYRWHLSRVDERPVAASKALIGLSNTKEYDLAIKYVAELRESLRIPDSIDV